MIKRSLAIIASALVMTGCSYDMVSSSGGDPAKRAVESGSITETTTTTTTTTTTAETTTPQTTTSAVTTAAAVYSSADEVVLVPAGGEVYSFDYGDKTFQAEYTENSWKIIDSYLIDNEQDMGYICDALTALHPIPTADGSGVRDRESLVYEWRQHNEAYKMLPKDSKWIASVKDVDLNPDDEGKDMWQMALDRLSER